MTRFNSFAEFYPFYLQEHRDPVCRRLHYIGSSLVVIVTFYALLSANYNWFWLLPVIGYGFAWVGHFFFEKNKPATFQHPFYSFLADWVMFKDAILSVMGYPTPLDELN
ncbi:Mpo1-like protein [Neptunicella sp. SCSIO 80796]|uniref:Mpo1-like protein n=1 Tax=Neptunicella plasticusilytica TaxID=3117012 RepID=UPI003A4DCB17